MRTPAQDTTLSTDCLGEAGLVWEEKVSFEEWWTEYLSARRSSTA